MEELFSIYSNPILAMKESRLSILTFFLRWKSFPLHIYSNLIPVMEVPCSIYSNLIHAMEELSYLFQARPPSILVRLCVSF